MSINAAVAVGARRIPGKLVGFARHPITQSFLSDKITLVAGIMIFVIVSGALFAPLIAPYPGDGSEGQQALNLRHTDVWSGGVRVDNETFAPSRIADYDLGETVVRTVYPKQRRNATELNPLARPYDPGETVLVTIEPVKGSVDNKIWEVPKKKADIEPIIRFTWSDSTITDFRNTDTESKVTFVGVDPILGKEGLKLTKVEFIADNVGDANLLDGLPGEPVDLVTYEFGDLVPDKFADKQWTLPEKVGDIKPGIRFTLSDGTVAEFRNNIDLSIVQRAKHLTQDGSSVQIPDKFTESGYKNDLEFATLAGNLIRGLGDLTQRDLVLIERSQQLTNVSVSAEFPTEADKELIQRAEELIQLGNSDVLGMGNLGLIKTEFLATNSEQVAEEGLTLGKFGLADAEDRFFTLGTDQLGRDQLTRIIYGGRISLTVGVAAVAIAATVGVFLGLVSGFYKGVLDDVIMRIVDMFMAVPSLLMALMILYILGPSFQNIIIVFAISRWMLYTRVTRGVVLSLRETAFVDSARAIGCSDGRILVRHILPNLIAPIMTLGALDVPRIILTEASLSFLGFGIQPPDSSWGLMLAQGREYITSAWWVVVMPGMAIFITALSFNLFGVWMRGITDPLQRWRWMKLTKEARAAGIRF